MDMENDNEPDVYTYEPSPMETTEAKENQKDRIGLKREPVWWKHGKEENDFSSESGLKTLNNSEIRHAISAVQTPNREEFMEKAKK